MALPGICGPANRPCKIVHVSSYPNDVGIYPAQCLPSTFTIWHAVFASQFSPALPLAGPGSILPGSIGGAIIDTGGFIPILPVTHTFQSHHYVIFARTANRFNVVHTVTQAEIDSVDESGQVQIDLGEYVFEAVSVTKTPIDDIEEQIELTEEEKDELEDDPNCSIGCSAESEEDRKFRKLFELIIPKNLLVGVVPNKEGIEYRFDNGSRKSKTAIDQAGLGDLDNPSYRDGTSKKIRVQFVSDPAVPSNEDIAAGNQIYLTYVAVREHYLRQRVSISWQVFDPGTAEFASTCISLQLGFSIAHYRFYEWDLEPEPGQEPTKLSGWRVVETFSSEGNFVAPVSVNGSVVLADFFVGGTESSGIKETPVLPGFSTPSELQTFIDDRNSLSNSEFTEKYGIDVNLTDFVDNGAFHVNAGKIGTVNTVYQGSDWFQRNQFNTYSNRLNANNHVFYNVHPKALRKRDIDKWGIERFLAVEIEKDINSGKITFFPFMDDPEVDNPTEGSNDFLSGANLLFQPVQPVSSYGGNFEAVCGSIGSFPTNPSSGINSYHSFESNRIEERFEIDTRVLVERNFAVGAGPLGPNLLTIECAGGSRGALSCIADPSGTMAFAVHSNDDNFVIFNPFNIGYIDEGSRKLIFRPDLDAAPIKDNSSPTVDQFEDLLGFTGMLGDIPGHQPGRAIASASFSSLSELLFKTTKVSALKARIPDLADDQIEEITFTQQSSLNITASNGYFGSMKIAYTLPKSSGAADKSREAMLLMKLGGTIAGVADSLHINESETRVILLINFRWMTADNFELVGPRVEHMDIQEITITGLSVETSKDFLSNANSHGASSIESTLSERLQGRGLFFATSVMTISEDQTSVVYVFFSDSHSGISAVTTNDFGDVWYYHYGVVENLLDREVLYPFAVTDFGHDICYLFYVYMNKILCKNIPLSMFKLADANLIERLDDIFTPANPEDSESVATESPSIYTSEGQSLRRRIPAFVAKGDLTDEAFLEVLGKVPGELEYKPFEVRKVLDVDVTVRKNPVARSPGTAFVNQDQSNMFFSAYRNDFGELKLWFMGKTVNGLELQCNFSVDDGQTWYDFWEFLDFGYNRLRYDPDKKTQFIDRNASGDPPESKEGADTQESNETSPIGINIHWSRLKKHKVNVGESSLNSESEVLGIASPYLFYQSTTDRVFLFYIYQGCLLCKTFSDSLFLNAAKARHINAEISGMALIKKSLEQQTRAHFIDGSLTNADLQEELHGFVRENEKMTEGNIIFHYSFIDKFTDDRSLSAQRVCAHDLPDSSVRVFYKHTDSSNIKSAIWTGSEWWAEDFLRDPTDLDDMELQDTDDTLLLVTGGFGETGFD